MAVVGLAAVVAVVVRAVVRADSIKHLDIKSPLSSEWMGDFFLARPISKTPLIQQLYNDIHSKRLTI